MKKWILSWLGLILGSFLLGQNDPMQGQDSLVLELERNEWLPENQKFKVDFPKIELKLPPVSAYQYKADSFGYLPSITLPKLKVEPLQKPTVEKLYQGYVEAHFSSLLQPFLAVNFHQGRNAQLDWGVLAEYEGLWKDYVPHAKRNFFRSHLYGGWHNEKFTFRTNLHYQFLRFNYFGDTTYRQEVETPDSIKSYFSFWTWSNELTYGSPQVGWYAQVPLEFVLYTDRWKNLEFQFITKPSVSYRFSRYTVGFEGTVQNATLRGERSRHSRTLLLARIYGMIPLGQSKIKLGAQWSQVDSLQYFLPEIEIRYVIEPKKWELFAGNQAMGTLHTLYELKRLYPYLEPSFYQQASIVPWKWYLGGKGNFQNIVLQVQGYYQKSQNFLILYANYADTLVQNRWVRQGYLTALYDKNTQSYGIEGIAEWNYHQNIHLKFIFHYQRWKLNHYEYNFHQPQIKGQLEARYLLNKKIEIFPKISYISAIFLGYLSDYSVIKQKDIWLVDLNVSYFIRSDWSVFIGGKNLLNQKYFLLRDYQELPLAVYAGLKILF